MTAWLEWGITLTALWHVLGFAFGLVYVRLSLLSLLGRMPYQPEWSRVLRHADKHLWLSGLALIALGLWHKGADAYLHNPKLWCKITVILFWMVSTQCMRHIGIAQLKRGNRTPMLHFSTINVSCWLYGAFLGVAKPLANGAVSYPLLLCGFFFTLLLVSARLRSKMLATA